jgi:hypothetical protein
VTSCSCKPSPMLFTPHNSACIVADPFNGRGCNTDLWRMTCFERTNRWAVAHKALPRCTHCLCTCIASKPVTGAQLFLPRPFLSRCGKASPSGAGAGAGVLADCLADAPPLPSAFFAFLDWAFFGLGACFVPAAAPAAVLMVTLPSFFV